MEEVSVWNTDCVTKKKKLRCRELRHFALVSLQLAIHNAWIYAEIFFVGSGPGYSVDEESLNGNSKTVVEQNFRSE